MCGIVACRTKGPAIPYLVGALERLEYRGYDSAGLALRDSRGRLATLRTVRHVTDLAERTPELGRAKAGTIGIGHTRWATHGAVTTANAHPHTDCHGRLAIAHNGIITNAATLRSLLEHLGHRFETDVDSDSEVIAHLVEEALEDDDLHSAVEQAVGQLEGSWAIVVLDARTGNLVATAKHSPLVLASTSEGQFVASDIAAIAGWSVDYQVLDDGDVVQISQTTQWRNAGRPIIPRSHVICSARPKDMKLGSHPDFMSKEIAEQPDVAARVVDAWGSDAAGPILWRSLYLPDFHRVAVVGCGSSLNAGRAVAGIFGRHGVPCQSIVASEAADAVVEPDTLVLALSQSGETADVLRALDVLATDTTSVLAITNNPQSALGRRADAVMACHAGHEVGVAATKTFVAQVLTGACAALSSLVTSDRLDHFDAQRLAGDLKRVPEQLEHAIAASHRVVPSLVSQLVDAPGYLYMGRGTGSVFADEGALKLQELSYRWAESFPAGELKHGALALVDDGTPVFVVDTTDSRLAASISEVEARGGVVVRIGGPESNIPVLGHESPTTTTGHASYGPIESVVAMQIFAREVAVALGRDVDRPRNLTKSVTVE